MKFICIEKNYANEERFILLRFYHLKLKCPNAALQKSKYMFAQISDHCTVLVHYGGTGLGSALEKEYNGKKEFVKGKVSVA